MKQFPYKEQLHKLAPFRLGEEMTEGGMTENNKIMCGWGKVSREWLLIFFFFPLKGLWASRAEIGSGTSGHERASWCSLGLTFWSCWPLGGWMPGRCEKLVWDQKAIKQISEEKIHCRLW